MVIDFLRIVSLIFLIVVTLVDIPINTKLTDPQVQFLIAFIILIVLLLVDVGTGFILAITIFIIYFKVYNKLFMKKKNNEEDNVNKINNFNYSKTSKLNYISPEILLSAQNNIVDVKSYNTEIKGITKGFNNENVYGAQGLDIDKNDYMGFEKNNYQLF